MDLRSYLNNAPRGTGSAVARAVGVHSVMVSQWASGTKPVPVERAPAIEAATDFQVRCEELCPSVRWVRVQRKGWPHGKPLIDNAPSLVPSPVSSASVAGAPVSSQGDRERVGVATSNSAQG